jgi:UDP-N-acetylmuramyl pentapeptide phosphotransferase/UDP-N-acetylglucosamine-1-phosphate transferase
MPLIILLFASFLISLLTVALIRQRFSQHLLDIPNERSSHTQPTSRGGGLGFILAFAATSGIVSVFKDHFTQFHNQTTNPDPATLWLILTPLALIGIIDDQRGIPASLRYLVQLVTAGLAVTFFDSFPQPWLTTLGTLGTILAIAFTVIGITALINFYNFLDGLDGLVAGVTAVQLGFLALYLNQPLFWLLVSALLGFLWWNWSPAKIFMGDAGSTVLGATVAIALLNTSNDIVHAWSALAITLPLVSDAIYTLVRRLIRSENILKAHRSHLYQRLQQSGWSHAQVASTYIALTLVIAATISFSGLHGAIISLVGVIVTLIVGELYLQSHTLKQEPKPPMGSTEVPHSTR